MERRIAKTVDGDVTAYVYDTSTENPLAHDDIVLEFEAGTTPFLERRWAHSVAVDEPLGYEQYLSTQDPGAGIERAMFADRQGSVLYMTSPVTDQVVAAYEYDGFGAITQTQGTMRQPYGYTGREFDAESGLYYYRARSYDPTTGMFVQSDPIGFQGGQLAIYHLVNNNTFEFSDPSGMIFSRQTASDIGRSGSNGIMATTTIGMAAIDRLANALAAFRQFSFTPNRTSPRGRPLGHCSELQMYQLNRAVEEAKGPRACSQLPRQFLGNERTVATIRMRNLNRMRAWSNLTLARYTREQLCFDGGDSTHRGEWQEAFRHVQKCWAILNFNNRKKLK